MNILKKISIFLTYRKEILNIEKDLKSKFNVRLDRAYRMYTVINIPPDIVDEPYNIRKSDIDMISQKFIKEYSQQLSKFLDSSGLIELYDFYNIEKVDKYSYLLVFGFKLLNTQKLFKNILFYIIPILLIISILTIFYLR
jgi:hypothetical protein